MELPHTPTQINLLPIFHHKPESSRLIHMAGRLFTSSVGEERKYLHSDFFFRDDDDNNQKWFLHHNICLFDSGYHKLSIQLRCEICKQCRPTGSWMKVIHQAFVSLSLRLIKSWSSMEVEEEEEICSLTIKVLPPTTAEATLYQFLRDIVCLNGTI